MAKAKFGACLVQQPHRLMLVVGWVVLALMWLDVINAPFSSSTKRPRCRHVLINAGVPAADTVNAFIHTSAATLPPHDIGLAQFDPRNPKVLAACLRTSHLTLTLPHLYTAPPLHYLTFALPHPCTVSPSNCLTLALCFSSGDTLCLCSGLCVLSEPSLRCRCSQGAGLRLQTPP